MNIYYENNTKEKTVLLTIPKATIGMLDDTGQGQLFEEEVPK